MQMRLLAAVFACLALLPQTAIKADDSVKPDRLNIVYLISDDHDNEHLGFMGNSFAHTPTLDALAHSGSVFTTAHLPMSRCHPTLASFLSGQHPHQSGIYYNYGDKKLSPVNSLPALLKKAGYATYVEGKYWEGDPREMGFTHGAGKTARTFVRKGQDDLFRFIDDRAGKQPMFIWWAPLIPHTPHNPPEKYTALFDWKKMPRPSFVKNTAGPDGKTGNANGKGKGKGKGKKQGWANREKLSYAMEAWLDDGVAQLVAKLKKAGEFENTLFVFVIDNGWCNGLPSKGSPFEKGVRTPVFFSHLGLVKSGQRLEGLISTNDIFPTILDYAGIKPPATASGRTLRPLMEGKSTEHRDALFGAIYPAFATKSDQRPERDIYAIYARTKKWKYIFYLQDVTEKRNGSYFRIQSITTDFPTRKAGDEDLYAIEKDPHELKNLAGDAANRKQMDELKARCLAWWQETGGKPFYKVAQ